MASRRLNSTGKVSTSVWEAEDKESLAAALDSLLSTFCETEILDVVEVRPVTCPPPARCSPQAGSRSPRRLTLFILRMISYVRGCLPQEHMYSKGMDAKMGSATGAGAGGAGTDNGLSKVTATTAAFASTSLEK